MSTDHHQRIQEEHDVEELRRLAHVHAAENNILRHRLQSLTSQLAEAKGISEQELFEQEAASADTAVGRGNKYGKGSRRSKRNRRRDNQGSKPKPPSGATPKQEQVVLELDEGDMPCPSCGKRLEPRESLDDTSKMITIEHTMVIEVEVTRKGYGCTCGHVENALPHDDQFLPGGLYSVAMIVQILVLKYYQSMPLNRQVKFFADHGLDITTQTMWDNIWRAAQMLTPVYLTLLAEAQAADMAYADETRWNVSGGKGTAWVWTLATAEAIVFMMRKSRDHTEAEALLGEFAGFLMTDGASAYTTVINERDATLANPELWDSGKPPPGPITRLGCWAHTRTYWCEAAEHFGHKAEPVIEAIGKLYRIVEAAETREPPDDVHRWVDTALATIHGMVEAMEVLPGTSLHEARRYTLNQWDRLTVFASQPGRLPLDNNFAERSLRTPVLGRKNFQGAKSPRGNKAAEVFYSLIMTCAHLGVAPKLYLDAAIRAARDGQVITPAQFKATAG